MAQTTSSILAGTVRSETEGMVPGALVQARDESTGTLRTATTDARGAYRIDLLEPGEWTVTATFPDGRRSETRHVTLRLQQTLRVDLTLGAGLTETVTVKGTAPMLDPQQTGGELRVTGDQADVLPVAGRVVTDLALLDASVRATPPGNFYGERGSVFVVNGQSGRANSFLVDGLDNNDRTSGTTLNAFFSQQVIREFVVLTHQFAPEFGRAAGGVLNIVTERGGNEGAGAVFVQGTRSGWNDEGDFVASLPRREESASAVERFQTGFKLGGPLKRDRAFAFVAFEHQRSDDVTPYTGVTRDGVAGGWTVTPNRDDNLFLRTDFSLTPTQTLMLRLSGDDRTTHDLNVGGTTTPETGFRVDERDLQLAASLTSIVSESVLNEARLLVSRSTFSQRANSDRPGVERPSGSFGGNNLNRQLRKETRLQLVDNVTVRTGAHTLKFGSDVTATRTDVGTRFNPIGNLTYNTDARFEPGDGYNAATGDDCTVPGDTIKPCPGMPGVDDDGDGSIDEDADTGTYPALYQVIFGEPEAKLRDTQIGVFAQDSWELGSKVVLDYGLRWDASTFRLPRGSSVPSTISNGEAGVDWNNVAPRLGFTLRPGAGGKLLLRGGAGVFYDKVVLGFPAVAAITSGTRIGLFFPQALASEVNEKYLETYGRSYVPIFFPDQLVLRFSTGDRLDTPYTTLYSLGFDWAVSPRGAVRADVVRALGYHQPLFRDLNPPRGTVPPGIPNHERDPNVGSIAAIVTEGRSWYSGLELGWRWRGESAWCEASYALSRALDLGPDPLKGGVYLPPGSDDLRAEKGRSDSDRRHRFVLAGEVPLPWMGLRVSGVFQLASGAPFNVTTGTDENLDGITSDRPQGVGRNTGEDTPLGPINELRSQHGLSAVRSLREPSFEQLDLRIRRPFSLRAHRGASEVFLQVFNLLDRFNGGPVEGRVTSRSFGRPIGQAGPPRTLELGVRLGLD